MTVRPASPAHPATLAPVWSTADADALALVLDQVCTVSASTRSSLRRTTLRTTADWRGPSRMDFDRRQARLIGALIDLEHFSASCARRIRARTAEIGNAGQTSFPLFAGTLALPDPTSTGR